MMRLSPLLSLCAIVTIVGSACGVDTAPDADSPSSRTVAIAPRVVMDGLKELAAREDGRVQIDEVVFHAGKATVDGEDLLPEADDDLIFRYSVGTLDDFGDVLGGVREWRIGEDDEHLSFTFDPLSPRRRTDVELATGVPLDQLSGHTAFVHGTVEVMSAGGGVTGFAACGDGSGSGQGESDPDTSPADCGDPTDDVAESDPDTSPADGGDAEGDSAESDGGDASESDPDTSPASQGAADGDPDTSPAEGDVASAEDGKSERTQRMSSRLERMVTRRVPFDLVITSSFTLERDTADLLAAEPGIDGDQLVPLDLHIRMDELFTEQRVDLLDKSARGGSASVVLEVSGAGAITLDTSNVKRKIDVGSHGIKVVSDPR